MQKSYEIGTCQGEAAHFSTSIWKATSKVTLICNKYSSSYVFVWNSFCWFCSLNTVILCATDAWFILRANKIYTYVLKKSYYIFPITKGSLNTLMKLAGFSTSNKARNHCYRLYNCNGPAAQDFLFILMNYFNVNLINWVIFLFFHPRTFCLFFLHTYNLNSLQRKILRHLPVWGVSCTCIQ